MNALGCETLHVPGNKRFMRDTHRAPRLHAVGYFQACFASAEPFMLALPAVFIHLDTLHFFGIVFLCIFARLVLYNVLSPC